MKRIRIDPSGDPSGMMTTLTKLIRWVRRDDLLGSDVLGRENDASLRRINPHPVAIHRTPQSILDNPANHQPLYIRGRSRLATCSGVAWFHGDHLATVNVLGRTIHVYRFDSNDKTLTLVQSLNGATGLAGPENLAISPNGRLLAITDSRDGVVKLFSIDRQTHHIDSNPQVTIKHDEDEVAHGISFSPCSRFLAYTTVDEPGQIRIYRIVQNESGIIAEPFQQIENTHSPLKPKGIDFSPDGSSLVVCFGPNAGFTPRRGRGRGTLMLYAFDERRGISPMPLSIGSKRLKLMSPDDVKFLACGDQVVVTQQATDKVATVAVESSGKKLGKQTLVLQNPQSHLSFPHGAGVCSDGVHLAITNYGDDTLAIYEILPPV